MIRSWKHKGLKKFFETGSTQSIQPKHASRLKIQLFLLHAAHKPTDMNLAGYRFHELKGDRQGFYSITVNGNWRITFSFEENDAILVNYEDYH